jgi:prepilin-type N-terminal cleavage/methylation domain-containing protein
MMKKGRRGIAQFLRPMNYLHSFMGSFFRNQRWRFLKNSLDFNILQNTGHLALNLLSKREKFKGNNLSAWFSKGFTPLEMPGAKARGKLKNSYTFSHWVNDPCESLLMGFTLVEILIVIALIGILTAIAAPNISAWVETFKFKNTKREIGITMQLARMKAIARGVEYRVVFDLDAETFSLERGNQADGSDTWIPEGVVSDVSSWADIAFVNSYATGKRNKQFNPNGTSSTGSIRLNNAKGEKYKITLTPATGYITIAEGW